MPVCGPKLSLCCTILSIWGIIQLVLMGIFFFAECVTLVEDIPLPKDYTYTTEEKFVNDVKTAYVQNAYNCWIAACLYLATLAISAHQLYLNKTRS